MKLTTAGLKTLIREELKKVMETDDNAKRYKASMQILTRLQNRSGLNKMLYDITGHTGYSIANDLKFLNSAQSIEIKSAAEKAKKVADAIHQKSPDDFNHKKVIAILDRIIKSAGI